MKIRKGLIRLQLNTALCVVGLSLAGLGLAQESEESDQSTAEEVTEAAENAIENVSDEVQQEATEAAQDEVDAATDDASEEVSDSLPKKNKGKDRVRGIDRETLKKVGKVNRKSASTEAPLVLGAGKTLPQDVLRIRLPFQNVYGDTGYDEDGNEEKQGAKINVKVSALVAEYGLTDKISLAFVAPYIISNKMGLDAENLRKNNYNFRREFGRYKDATAALLRAQGQCATMEACNALLNNPNFTVPAAQNIVLTTGEVTTALPNEPALRQIDRLLTTPITPDDGETGLGDITLGGLYNFYADNMLSLSAGGGLRLATGKFSDVPRGQRATGGGTTDIGLRFNFDFQPHRAFVLALAYQPEIMLSSGTKNKTSGLYSDRLNTGDPTTAAAIAIGSDGKDNEQKFERVGVGQNASLTMNFGLGAFAPVLNSLSTSATYSYFRDRETRYDGLAYDSQGYRFDARRWGRSYTVGLGWSGLAMSTLIPLGVSIDHTQYLAGQNLVVAPNTTAMQIMGYYKF